MSFSSRDLPAGGDLVDEELAAGTVVDGYVVERLLGAGGCATVYAVSDPVRGGSAALKVLHRSLMTSPKLVERFTREVAIVQRLRHPAIVEIFDFGRLTDGRPYYLMELLDGTDLEGLVKSGGRLSPAEALELFEPMCAALDLAHRAGVIHRDLKASNVILSGAAGRRQVKLVDFGVARTPSPLGRGFSVTSIGRQVGTPFVMAPEQIRTEPVDERTDVYALGVLLFYVLTRHYPFELDDPLEVELAHLEAPAPRPSKLAPVGRAVDAVVLKCLEKRPEARPQSALAFLNDLRTAVGGAARPQGSAGPALAVYVEARLDGVPGEIRDDEADDLLFEQSAVIDVAQEALKTAGFAFPLRTSSTLVGVRAVAVAGDAEMAERRQLLGEIAALHARLTAMTATGRIQVIACVHKGEALLLGGDSVSGDILKLDSWIPSSKTAPSAWATTDALAGMQDFHVANGASPRYLWMIRDSPGFADRTLPGKD